METTGETPRVLTPEEETAALALARKTLELYLSRNGMPDDDALGVPPSGPFRSPGAVFVTLTRRGRLRGCIGHIVAVEPLWESIRDNAVAAAAHDPRFPPVTREELDGLALEISLLTPPRLIAGPQEFQVGRHGIILELGHNRAVFLPQVATEQGWDRETTLAFLSEKAGLDPHAWRNPRTVFRVFEAQVFHEPRKEAR